MVVVLDEVRWIEDRYDVAGRFFGARASPHGRRSA
jgi:hypothetical protein